jgi:hypothetical protein
MGNFIEHLHAWLVAIFFAAAMFACWGAGFRHGRSVRAEPKDDPDTKFVDAGMALLGLLLAFTFSMSLGRHDQRRLAVVAESNAIGDFYTCATLLKEPQRSRLREVVHEYAKELLKAPQEAKQSADQHFGRMTDIVHEAIKEGTPIVVPLTNTLNNVTSSNASRLAAYQESLPWSIILLLFLSSIVPAYLIGAKQGASHRLHLSGSFSFIILVSLVVFVTLDLNQPRRGLIKVNQKSLERLIEYMEPKSAGGVQ